MQPLKSFKKLATALVFSLAFGALGSQAVAGEKLSLASLSYKQHPHLGRIVEMAPTLHPKWQRVRNEMLSSDDYPMASFDGLLTLEPAAGEANLPTDTGVGSAWDTETLYADPVHPDRVGPLTKRELAARIHSRILTLRYQEDAADYWQTPRETIARGAGDCEDFAIMAFHLALNAGIDASDLGLAVGYDKLNRAHAVMVMDVGDNLLSIDLNEQSVRPIAESGFKTKFIAQLDRLVIVR